MEKRYSPKITFKSLRDREKKANARMTVCWPGMTKDIEEMVSSCEKYMKYHNKQPKEPMQTRDVPLLPWQVVASDILEHKNQHYLVIH